MATVTATRYARATNGRRNTEIIQYFGISATNTDITIASLTDTRPRRLVSVSIKYSANSSTTVTVTHNYLGGPGGTSYDVLLNSTALAAQTDYIFLPSEEIWLSGNDTVTVLAPAVAAATAAVVIEVEIA